MLHYSDIWNTEQFTNILARESQLLFSNNIVLSVLKYIPRPHWSD